MGSNRQHAIAGAVILCGGFGTRLRAVAGDLPKGLVKVCGRPFLEWLILALARREGLHRVTLATGHSGDAIERHFGHDLWCGVHVSYSHEPRPLGTGGAVRLAASQNNANRLLVLNGDSFCRFDLDHLFAVHVANQARATLWLTRTDDPHRFGSVATDSNGEVIGFKEKEPAGDRPLASAGVYLIEREVIESIAQGQQSSLELDVFPSLVGDGLYGVEGLSPFVDIGTPASLANARETLPSQLEDLDCE